nr:hypothetical protein [Planococcus glaciei]
MLVFVGLIIVSFVFYFYYKTKQFRAVLPIRKNGMPLLQHSHSEVSSSFSASTFFSFTSRL